MPDAEGYDAMSRRGFIVTTSATTVAAQLGGAVTGTTPTAVMQQAVTLEVNGKKHELTIESRVTLLDALRDALGLTGTKKGCDQGTCGACTVLVNDRRVLSCLTLAVMHERDRVTTIEGIAPGEGLHPLQEAFIEHDAFQCGYCTSGQIVSAKALLEEGHSIDRATVAREMSGNLCRCGCYQHIVDAVVDAAGQK